MQKTSYTHILQKAGVLKNFTVAKVVNKKDIDELRKLVKSMTSNEEEFKQILSEEMGKISNMHSRENPIPGIIYPRDDSKIEKMLFSVTKKFCINVRAQSLSKRDMAFLITAIINELGLTQEDFMNLKDEIQKNKDDEDDEDDSPPKF